MSHKYPPIADHGLIGDLQTCALVDLNGTIGWFCSPRFDSPSIFASLLDAEKGGHFSLRAVGDGITVKQLYLVDTCILITRYLAEHGVGEVIDFMPIDKPHEATDTHRIVRIARVIRGEVTFELECAPAFDYGRQEHHMTLTDHHALFSSEDFEMSFHSTAMLDLSEGKSIKNGAARASVTLQEGQMFGCTLTTGPDSSVAGALKRHEANRLAMKTIEFWREWVGNSTYTGRWRERINRSALTLKLLTYAPTGAIVAAPTTSLPEQLGGERNWDYRYTWVRDGSFSVMALMELGFTDEAAAFLKWLVQRVREAFDTNPNAPLNLMYKIDGKSDLEEAELDHWEGYHKSAPVRIGNGAADQLQLDIYGEAVDAAYHLSKFGRHIDHETWTQLCEIMVWLAGNWDRPDEGIWETRGGQQDFTYSRLMCWVAFDRVIRLARDRGLPAPLDQWLATRDQIYNQIQDHAWNPKVGAYTQYYGADVVDAALLKMPLVGFVSPRDPRWLSTMEVIQNEIVSDSLVFRYNPSATPDGLAGDEGTFSICTFWFVDALVRQGAIAEARLVFEQMMTYSNHLGLYSEEIGPRGEQLGNFPQAFTHLALITAATNLNKALDAGGKVEYGEVLSTVFGKLFLA